MMSPNRFSVSLSEEELRIDEEIRQLENHRNHISSQRVQTPQSMDFNQMQQQQQQMLMLQQQQQFMQQQQFLYQQQQQAPFNPYQFQLPGPYMMMTPPSLFHQQPQQQQPNMESWGSPAMYHQQPLYPQGYYIPPYMNSMPPSLPNFSLPPSPQKFAASPPYLVMDKKEAQVHFDALNQFAAQEKMNNPAPPSSSLNIGLMIGNAVTFVVNLLGSSALVLVKDMFDTTSERKPTAASTKVTLEELQQVEAVAAPHELATLAQLNNKQKLSKLKSVRRLLCAKSVREVVNGLKNSGRLEEAESLARRVLAIRRQMYGDDHEATAHALNQLASVLSRKQMYGESEEMFKSALLVFRASTSEKPRVIQYLHEAHLLHNLACVSVLNKNKEQALQYGKECVALCETKLGSKHEKTKHFKRVWGVSN